MKPWEDDPAVHAELERQALAELEARGGIAAEVERASWERRVREAIKDGLDLAGKVAVRDALAKLVVEFGIKGAAGRKREGLTAKQLKAAEYAAEHLDSDKLTDGRLAGIAGMSPQHFSQQFAWRHGSRWGEFWGVVSGLHGQKAKDSEQDEPK